MQLPPFIRAVAQRQRSKHSREGENKLSPSSVQADAQEKGCSGPWGPYCPRWLFSSSAQQGSERPWGQPCQATSGEAQGRVSKAKETILVEVTTTAVPKHCLVALGDDMALSGLFQLLFFAFLKETWHALSRDGTSRGLCIASTIPSLPPDSSRRADCLREAAENLCPALRPF